MIMYKITLTLLMLTCFLLGWKANSFRKELTSLFCLEVVPEGEKVN